MSRAGRRLPVLRFARRMRVKTIARLAHGKKPHRPPLRSARARADGRGAVPETGRPLLGSGHRVCAESHICWLEQAYRIGRTRSPAESGRWGDVSWSAGQSSPLSFSWPSSPHQPASERPTSQNSASPVRGRPGGASRARAGSTLTCTGEWSTVGNSSFGTAWHLGRRTLSRPAPSACRSRQSGRSLRTRDASALTKVVPKFRQLGGQAAPRVTHREDVQRQWCTVRQTTPRDIENITPRGPSRDDRSTATGTKEPPVGVSRRPMRPRSPSGPRRTATASKTTLELPRRSATCGSLASTVVALRVWLTCLRLVGREAVEQSSTPRVPERVPCYTRVSSGPCSTRSVVHRRPSGRGGRASHLRHHHSWFSSRKSCPRCR